jgi:phage tail sheath protein FI
MPETFLHGVEVVEITDGPRPIQTVRSSIIGIVGTAPDAQAGVAATLTLGTSTASLAFTAVAADATGNDVSIAIIKPATNNATLAVTVTGKAVTISLATNGSAVATSTAAQVKTAYDLVAGAVALATVATSGGGAGTVATSVEKFLTGGLDAAFPLNTPVLVTPGDGQVNRLGESGTLYRAIDNIWKQAGAVLVVVRVAQVTSDTSAGTISNVAGDSITRTGVFALLNAESTVGFAARILIAPGFTQETAVLTNYISVANSIKGFIFADGPNSTDAAAIAYGGGFGSRRVKLVDPRVKVLRGTDIVVEPASSFFAGIQAQIDNTLGFWWSESNKEILGIVGLARPIDFVLGDSNSRANLLNEQNVATIIRYDGYRTWGNRTLSSDSKWAFASVVRTADILNESILRAHMWAVDRNITKTYLEDVTESVNAYMRSLIAQGALIGEQDVSKKVNVCYPDPDLNSPANISAGKVYFNFVFTTPYPAERVTFSSELNTNGLVDLLS